VIISAYDADEISLTMRETKIPASPLVESQRQTWPARTFKELVDTVVEMKRRNPNYGCPRIAQQINLVFGTTID
jgi:hypothetical protein